jgi:hypothetical protein
MRTTSVWVEIKRAAKEAPKMYFAPLIGAVRGIQIQYRQLEKKRGGTPLQQKR